LKQVLGIPRQVKVLAYLCLGYVSEFAAQPDLETAGWRSRIPVEQLIHHEVWGSRAAFTAPDHERGKR
jgi:5,6-dimethylbenzimidazole synthase